MAQPFLRIPPFPGTRARPLAAAGATPIDDSTALELAHLLRIERVGGSYWAARPPLPRGRDLMLAPSSAEQAAQMLQQARHRGLLKRCFIYQGNCPQLTHEPSVPLVGGPADPWHLAGSAQEVWAGANDEISLVAALSGTTVRTFGEGRFDGCGGGEEALTRRLAAELGGWSYRCPFSGAAIGPGEAARTLGEWRRLIDRNRSIRAVLGVAAWKRPTVDALLWDGSHGPPHGRELPKVDDGTVVTWKSRTPAALLDQLQRSHVAVAEIEDGLIRGRGLGANCIPPLSVVVDMSGIYFDPSTVSDLEQILESAELDAALVQRAARLRQQIVDAGISKYAGPGTPGSFTSPTAKRTILVVGQVEDDRSILSGGAGQSNLELLERARSLEPDAWLVYRPHPDVEAGHRKGYVPDEEVRRLADEIDRGSAIVALIDRVDELHCITSLAGFEALLRDKPVTTHGVPFYAGWGLTKDLGPVPARRSRRRTVDELTAAALILYPRYIDPVTRLPCSPEILVDRIAAGQDGVAAPLAGVRVLQGKLRLALRRLREMAA